MNRGQVKLVPATNGQTPYRTNCGSLYSTLARIPSLFERLIYVASLAKSQGEQSHGQMAFNAPSYEEVRAEHLAVFEDWLSLSLREKQADIELCASNQGRTAVSLLLSWARAENHQSLLPASALAPQRDLLAMELKVLFLVV